MMREKVILEIMANSDVFHLAKTMKLLITKQGPWD